MLDEVRTTQEHIADLLCAQVEGGELPGAMLFCGPRFAGKLHCAYQLASELGAVRSGGFALSASRDFQLQVSFAIDCFCSNPSLFTRAFLLENMGLFLSQFHSALMVDDKMDASADSVDEIKSLLGRLSSTDSPRRLGGELQGAFDSASKSLRALRGRGLGIAQVRSLQSWAYMTNASDGCRFIVLDNIEDANDSVKNSLLKILEEPPQGVAFVLISAHPERVMPTILSRARRYYFPPISSEGKRRLLASLGKADPSPQLSLEDSFASLVSSSLSCGNIAKGFLDDTGFDIAGLLQAVVDQRVAGLFFRQLAAEVQELLRQGLISDHEAQSLAAEIRDTARRAEVFNQNPKLTIEALFYRIGAAARRGS